MTMSVVTFKIERDLLELVESMRINTNMNRSEFIRHALQYYIEHEYKPNNNVTKAKVEKGVRF